jgi:hypothetical protein
VPKFLDPLGTPPWHAAVLDYAAAVSPRRDAQMRRLPACRATTWDAHVGSVLELVDAVRRQLSARQGSGASQNDQPRYKAVGSLALSPGFAR